MTRSPATLALLAAVAILAWWNTTVRINYQSNWTALFCTGTPWKLPPEIDAGTYRFADSRGYDGQFYRLVAHDLALTAGYHIYVDAPSLRWRRILVPGLAWALALGNRAYIDAAYIFVVLLFCALGVYALSRWLVRRGRHPAGGLLFLLLPGTLISLDRMTVDVALYTLIFLCLVWDEEGKDLPLWFALAACPLVRDLGVLVVGAFFAAEFVARNYRRALWTLTTLLPIVPWFLYVRAQLASHITSPLTVTPEIATWAFQQSGYGLILRMLSPSKYTLPPAIANLARALDNLALIAVVLCVVLTLWFFRWRTATKPDWVAFAFAALFFVASAEAMWRDLFSWGRAYTPALGLLVFTENAKIRRWAWLPLAAVTVRVVLQFGTQGEGILRSLVSR